MAMALDSATQPSIQSDIDFDMDNTHAQSSLDFDIDIELEGDGMPEDVEVNDAPQQLQVDSHHGDELMHEELSAEGDFEMEEHVDPDENMDETIYHEAESQITLEEAQLQDVDHLEPTVTSNLDHGGDASLRGEEPSEESTLTTKEPEIESVATSATLEATVLDEEQDAGTESNTRLDNELNEDEISFENETANQKEEVNDPVDDGEAEDEDILDTGNVEADTVTLNHDDHALTVEHDEPNEAEDESPESFSQQKTIDEHEPVIEEEEYSNLTYNATIVVDGQALDLFDSHSEDDYSACFLHDGSLAERPLAELLAACRTQLGEAVHDDQVLGMEVSGLHLVLSEHDDDCSEITLSQIIDVYHHLNSNEEVYEPEQIRLNLSIRSKPMRQLNHLFKEAEAGKGYSTLTTEVDDEDAEGDSNKETPASAEGPSNDTLDNNEFDEYAGEDAPSWELDEPSTLNAETVPETSLDHTSAEPEATDNISIVAEAPVTAVVDESETLLTETTTANLPPDSAEGLDPDDLIDYSDDEDEIEDPEKVAQNSTAFDDNVDEYNIDVESRDKKDVFVASEQPLAPASNSEDINDTNVGDLLESTLVHHDTSNIPAEVTTIDQHSATAEELGHETTDNLNSDLLEYTGEDDGIDFGFNTDIDAEQITAEYPPNSGSPSAKRSWDEIAADSTAAVTEQDSKRIRSHG